MKFLRLPDGVELELVLVPAGEFRMGSDPTERGHFRDEVPHPVKLTRPFFLGRFEVTQEQWRAVMGSLPSDPCKPCRLAPRQPATCMSWRHLNEADGFFDRLNRYLTDTGQLGSSLVRLPTEAEWEYAARAGTTTRFSFGDAHECDDGCVFCDELARHMVWCGNDHNCADEVGGRGPNAFGLYDMHGNVWEWVADRLGKHTAEPAVDPTGPARGSHHVIRSCSWTNQAVACRSAARNADSIDHVGDILGFRVAMTADAPALDPASPGARR